MTKMSTDTTTRKRIEVRHDLQPPGKFQVIFMNDDVTHMDFVVMVLCDIFGHTTETAAELMLQIHNDGSAIVALLDYEIAEQKAIETTLLARNNNFPLDVRVKPND